MLTNCEHGHRYDSAAVEGCPICRATERRTGAGADSAGARPLPPRQVVSDATRSVFALSSGGCQPVIGWLVAIDGPIRGRDFRLSPGRNSIGRLDHHRVAIADPAVSRDEHAVLTFDPTTAECRLWPVAGHIVQTGEHGAFLTTSLLLRSFDAFKVGATTLLYVALCGERFRWDAKEPPRCALS
jgi:hypothetical protein